MPSKERSALQRAGRYKAPWGDFCSDRGLPGWDGLPRWLLRYGLLNRDDSLLRAGVDDAVLGVGPTMHVVETPALDKAIVAEDPLHRQENAAGPAPDAVSGRIEGGERVVEDLSDEAFSGLPLQGARRTEFEFPSLPLDPLGAALGADADEGDEPLSRLGPEREEAVFPHTVRREKPCDDEGEHRSLALGEDMGAVSAFGEAEEGVRDRALLIRGAEGPGGLIPVGC